MNNVPRKTLNENEIQSTKDYVRNYKSFMQNKPNVKDAQINVSNVITTNYEQQTMNYANKNKPNSNPIKPNFKRAQMNVNLTLTKDYRKNDDFTVRKNKPNFRNAKNERKLICYRGL